MGILAISWIVIGYGMHAMELSSRCIHRSSCEEAPLDWHEGAHELLGDMHGYRHVVEQLYVPTRQKHLSSYHLICHRLLDI